jgi:UDP-glucose-4-epimerase GalE
MDVLVTGGAGYIGSHCCKELHRRGYNPVTVDNLVYGHAQNVKWGPFYRGDIEDARLLERIFSENRIDAVMHFAAYAYVGESVQDPRKYYTNNLGNTITLLEKVLERAVPSFIFSSSCATYGQPQEIPIDEDHPQRPINPYGRSKYMIEQILADYSNAYDLRFISLRYFNAAGADPDGEIGEDHTPETHLIPLILDVAKGRRENLEVYGNDYETADGSCVRDYIHVADLAAAHVSALEKLLSGASSDCLNLGTGEGFSVLQVIEQAAAITGQKILYRIVGRRPGDPAVLIASNSRAAAVLNWKPVLSDLPTIIQTAWNWHRKI